MTKNAGRSELEELLTRALDGALECAEECPACGAPIEVPEGDCWVRRAEELLGRTTRASGRKHP